jgi:hypothetical protein
LIEAKNGLPARSVSEHLFERHEEAVLVYTKASSRAGSTNLLPFAALDAYTEAAGIDEHEGTLLPPIYIHSLIRVRDPSTPIHSRTDRYPFLWDLHTMLYFNDMWTLGAVRSDCAPKPHSNRSNISPFHSYFGKLVVFLARRSALIS